MNIKALLVLIGVILAVVWLVGSGVESLQEENTQEDVLGNTLDAARGAAKNLSN